MTNERPVSPAPLGLLPDPLHLSLGQRIARRIEDMILSAAVPVGTRIGSEADLIKEHSISRPVFREAVRILEHDGIARVRRGPGGGLFVSAPETAAVTHAAALWLRWNGAGLHELYDARETLEARCASWAAERIDQAGATELRAMLERESELAAMPNAPAYSEQTLAFHRVIARLSGNQVSELFVMTLCELTPRYFGAEAYAPEQVANRCKAHSDIAEAVIAGDAAVASRCMITHLRANRATAHVPQHSHTTTPL